MGTIYGNGINQGDLYTLMNTLRTNFNGVLSKLDSDGGVNDTDYNSTYQITFSNTTASSTGLDQDIIVTFLNDFITNFNATCTKLDSDSGVGDTNYNSTLAITDVVDSLSAGNVYKNGINQSALVALLNSFITQLAALNAKLDADSGVSDTDYASTYDVTDTVDETGTSTTA